MNPEKWNRIADGFANGTLVPANGMDAWNEQACTEATLIRRVLPEHVETLLEIGCGVGRLTVYLAVMFRYVLACDSSERCRELTRERCQARRNVTVVQPGAHPCDAALVWGNLYDDDWPDRMARTHLESMLLLHRLVLVQCYQEILPLGATILDSGDSWWLLSR